MIIEEALEEADAAPVTTRVADGGQALDFLRRQGYFELAHRPDLILLDLNLPGMNGLDVLQVVKTDPDLRRIPVVVLTTSNAARDVLASYERQANAFVTKPLDLDSFERAVRLINSFFHDVAVLPG
jgi:CheY-like chemotaxis protein